MDFAALTLLGWFGVLFRVAYIITVVVKPAWHFNYEERLIQIRDVDKYVYSEEIGYVYMGLRFLISTFIMWKFTGLLIGL